MNCPRCKKDSVPERLSLYTWLEASGLDALQTAYVIRDYGHPLCAECLQTLKSTFYACHTNPYLKPKHNNHD